MSQPNLCQGSWQLTRSSSASCALNFVSSYRRWNVLVQGHHCDESSVYAYYPETKWQSSQWKSLMSPRPKKARQVKSNLKSLIITFFDSTKNFSQQARLWIPGSTAKFCGDCVKTCEDITPNFGGNRPGCFSMTTPRLTLPSSLTSFWRKTKLVLSPTHCTPLIWHPVTSSYFQNWNWSWKDASLISLRRSRLNHSECLTLWQKRTSRKRSKSGGDGGTSVYTREGTNSRVTEADRPYGEFYDFYSVSPENFGSTHVCMYVCTYVCIYRHFTWFTSTWQKR